MWARNREKLKETSSSSSQQWEWAASCGGPSKKNVFGGCGSFLASAQCFNTTANSVTGGINSPARRPYRKHHRHRCITHWRQQTKEKRERKEREKMERVCRMCWENRAQWYIANEYFKGSSVMWRGRKWRHRRILRKSGHEDTFRLIPGEEHIVFIFVSGENTTFISVAKLVHLLHRKTAHLFYAS